MSVRPLPGPQAAATAAASTSAAGTSPSGWRAPRSSCSLRSTCRWRASRATAAAAAAAAGSGGGGGAAGAARRRRRAQLPQMPGLSSATSRHLQWARIKSIVARLPHPGCRQHGLHTAWRGEPATHLRHTSLQAALLPVSGSASNTICSASASRLVQGGGTAGSIAGWPGGGGGGNQEGRASLGQDAAVLTTPRFCVVHQRQGIGVCFRRGEARACSRRSIVQG